MSKILNIRATSVLKNASHNSKILSVIDRQPVLLIDPSYMPYTNGQLVNKFIALGTYAENQKTFNTKLSEKFPIYKENALNGLPALVFDKNSMIATAENIAAPHDGKPIVKVQVWKFDFANIGSGPRIWATSRNKEARTTELLHAAGVRLDSVLDTKSININNTETYSVMVEYFNGVNSKFIMNGITAKGELVLPTKPFEVFSLARWYGIETADASITGEMYYGAMYLGDTTDDQLKLLYNDVAQRFGLSTI